jgi:hypothetical protein
MFTVDVEVRQGSRDAAGISHCTSHQAVRMLLEIFAHLRFLTFLNPRHVGNVWPGIGI